MHPCHRQCWHSVLTGGDEAMVSLIPLKQYVPGIQTALFAYHLSPLDGLRHNVSLCTCGPSQGLRVYTAQLAVSGALPCGPQPPTLQHPRVLLAHLWQGTVKWA